MPYSFSEWLHMGGYAFYVWSSYAVTAVLLLLLIAVSLSQWKRTRKQLSELEKRS